MDLKLTSEERDFLIRELDVSLAETRVEVHRTHFSPSYRDELKKEEALIRGLLDRLRPAAK